MSIKGGLIKATIDTTIEIVVPTYLLQGKLIPVSGSFCHKLTSSTEPDWSEVLPVIAVVFSPQFSSYVISCIAIHYYFFFHFNMNFCNK